MNLLKQNRLSVLMARSLILLGLVGMSSGGPPALAADSPSAIEVQSVELRLLLEAEVPSQEAGLVTAVNVREGKAVKGGDVLMQLDDRKARMAERAAKLAWRVANEKASNDVKLRYARKAHEVAVAELKRSNESIESFPKSVSDSQLDVERLTVEKTRLEQEQAEFESQIEKFEAQIKEQELASAHLAIERRQIVAPFDGIVVQVYSRLGEWNEPGQKALRLVNVDRLKAEGFIAASEATTFGEDSPVRLTLVGDAAPAEGFKGQIVFVSPEVDPITNQVRVWAEVDNTSRRLRPGQPVRMVIEPADAQTAEREPNAQASAR